jgi:PPOX class probable F420-dependent enzyme
MATTPTDLKNLAELYDLAPLEWRRIVTGLEAGFPQAPGDGGPDRHSSWVATINADGSPHVTGVGSIWHDGTFWFETGETTVKGRNIARDPRCSLSLATKGFDLVVEGVAQIVTDPTKVAELAAIWAAGGWPCRPDETGSALTADFSAPSAGPPPWRVYRIDVHRATALETVEPGGATRWTF